MSAIVRHRRLNLGLLVVALLVLPGSASAVSAQPVRPEVTHGVVVGDVTARSAELWARADRAATAAIVDTAGTVQYSLELVSS
jgi:phosphodiesterase/alkaline phosphatase D-like protein